MSVADVLKKIGDWTRSTDLIKVVAKEFKISDRQAYRKIVKETKAQNAPIKKIVLPDRSVVYGLSNWPLKEDDLKILIEALSQIILRFLLMLTVQDLEWLH